MRKTLASLGCAVIGVVACSSAESVGRSEARVDTICNEAAGATIDGIPSYAYCGNFDVWTNNGIDTKSTSGGAGWIRTETNYGYQCTELALRYLRFRFGVTTVWTGISYADQMCGTHPAAVSVTNTPAHGDLMVFGAGSCGADSVAGHVAVVDQVGASTIDVVQQNASTATATYATNCASCFLHAAHNLGTDDPCEASTGDGAMCGQTSKLASGTKDVLYHCAGGVTQTQTTCTAGCLTKPLNTDDQCAPVAADAGIDAAVDDAAAPPADAAPAPDASPPPTDDAGAGDGSSSGGGCAIARASDHAPSLGWVATMVAMLAARIRRRPASRARTSASSQKY